VDLLERPVGEDVVDVHGHAERARVLAGLFDGRSSILVQAIELFAGALERRLIGDLHHVHGLDRAALGLGEGRRQREQVLLGSWFESATTYRGRGRSSPGTGSSSSSPAISARTLWSVTRSRAYATYSGSPGDDEPESEQDLGRRHEPDEPVSRMLRCGV